MRTTSHARPYSSCMQTGSSEWGQGTKWQCHTLAVDHFLARCKRWRRQFRQRRELGEGHGDAPALRSIEASHRSTETPATVVGQSASAAAAIRDIAPSKAGCRDRGHQLSQRKRLRRY